MFIIKPCAGKNNFYYFIRVYGFILSIKAEFKKNRKKNKLSEVIYLLLLEVLQIPDIKFSNFPEGDVPAVSGKLMKYYPIYRAFEEKSGSLVVLRPSFLSPAASPGVGI